MKEKAIMKAKVGRPTSYDPTWMLDKIIELMEEGASLVEVSAALNICPDTLHRWRKEIPEFSDTIKRGVRLSQAWWESQGRTNLKDKFQGDRFNSTLWYMNMKNRFKWSDKQDIEVNTKIEISIDGDDSDL